MSDEKVTLTEEQQHQVFDELSGVDAESAEALAKAEKETEESNYTEATAMEANVDIPGVGIPVTNPKDINEAKEDYLEVMKEYDLTDEEAVSLYNVIRLYKDGNKQGLYDRLPQRLKSIADGIVCNFPMAAPKVKRITKDSAAEFIIESMINDAKINNVFDEYDRDMRNLTNDMDKDFSAIMAEAMNESFENIEQIKSNAFSIHNNGESLVLYSDQELTRKRIELFPYEQEGNAGIMLHINKAIGDILEIQVNDETVYCQVGSLYTNTRNYNGGRLFLFSEPTNESSIIGITTIEQAALVMDAHGTWLKVQCIDEYDEPIVGWIPSNMQCPSPWTTCN